MRPLILSLIVLYFLPFPLSIANEPVISLPAESSDQVVIVSPRPGQAIRAACQLLAYIIPGYKSAELSFAYAWILLTPGS
jgi:hypothetical protein